MKTTTLSRNTAVLGAAVLLAIAALASFGYRAVRGWRESAAQLSQRRAAQTTDMLLTAVTRDMRGVQTIVLSSPRADEFMLQDPHDVRGIAASAFARFPYPESFFAWRGNTSPEAIIFFDRADRRPPAAENTATASRFPVVVASYPVLATRLASVIGRHAAEGRRFSTFEMDHNQIRYQIVARLFYRDALHEHLESVLGFTVNIDWIRRNYFGELTRQVARISGAGQGLILQVVDEHGRAVVAVPQRASRAPAVARPFHLQFFDPLTMEGDVPSGRPWRVEVSTGDDPTLSAAVRAGNRTLFMIALAAGALALGLLLAFRAARASAQLAELRSDFVSTVTHELKTPIASIRAMGDTLARDRIADPVARAEYAQMIVQESKRLTRLIDNLLAYSRITDVTEVYAFEAVDMQALIEDVLQGFSPQLTQQRFEIQVDISRDLPRVRGDRTALRLMLDNIVDNAMRYSESSKSISLTATASELTCTIAVDDRGIGIPADDLERVTRRFQRGRNVTSGGSGLGLAIVKRIVSDHGGSLSIESRVGGGTSVRVDLPLAGKGHEEADSDR